MQVFKYNHLTSVYNNGVYTLTPDKGYLLRNKETGKTLKKVITKYYTYYETVEAPAEEQEYVKNQKANATLATIFDMAHDMDKLRTGDERLEALEKALMDKFPECDNEEKCPPISDVLTIMREVGLDAIADAFDKAWADEDPVPVIESMPDATDADGDGTERTGEGEGEGTERAGEGDGEGEKIDEQPAEKTPAEETPAKEAPAEETPAEESPKTETSKTSKKGK